MFTGPQAPLSHLCSGLVLVCWGCNESLIIGWPVSNPRFSSCCAYFSPPLGIGLHICSLYTGFEGIQLVLVVDHCVCSTSKELGSSFFYFCMLWTLFHPSSKDSRWGGSGCMLYRRETGGTVALGRFLYRLRTWAVCREGKLKFLFLSCGSWHSIPWSLTQGPWYPFTQTGDGGGVVEKRSR